MNEIDSLRLEKLAFLVGTIMGHISEILNKMKNDNVQETYQSLRDLHNMAALQIHELYYKEKENE